MMGGYLEEGLPFYFVNRQMLDYLGYDNEGDFYSRYKRIDNQLHAS